MARKARELTPGDKNCAWIEKYCRIPEGRDVGKPVKLRPWQRKEIKRIYDTPTRTFILSFGRKNGKTALIAFIVLLHLCGRESTRNSEVVSGARSRDQAAMVFRYASKCARLSVDLASSVVIKDTAKEIVCPERGTTYKALSADASTNFGRSPVLVIQDELGQVRGPRDEFYEAMDTSQGAHENPLTIIISTQAPTDADLLSLLIDDALSGKDPMLKVALYTAPKDVDPFSTKAIKAANPAYGDFLEAEECHRTAEGARRMPSREASYRNLILNQRVNMTNPFIAQSAWESCGGAVDLDALRFGEVYLGLDLSSRNDLTAIIAVAKDHDGAWQVESQFFTPQIGLAERAHKDRVPYDQWVREGYLTATPGASVDYEVVARWLAEYCSSRDVRRINFDRWRIDVLKAELARIGAELPLEPFGQGFRDMTPALDALESEISNANLRHGSNPVLTMCAANAVATRDPAGNRKLDKSKATGRIDGMVALAMAMGGASAAVEAKPAEYQMIVF